MNPTCEDLAIAPAEQAPRFPTLEDLAVRLGGDRAGQRFLRFLEPGPVPPTRPHLGPCVMWTGGVSTPYNYGAFKVDGKSVRPHRWLWQVLNGPVPEGLDIAHECHDWTVCTPGPSCPHRRCVVHTMARTRRDNLMAGGTPASIRATRRWCEGEFGPHDLHDEANVYRYPDGRRECIPCKREQDRRYRAGVRATRRAQRAQWETATGVQLRLL